MTLSSDPKRSQWLLGLCCYIVQFVQYRVVYLALYVLSWLVYLASLSPKGSSGDPMPVPVAPGSCFKGRLPVNMPVSFMPWFCTLSADVLCVPYSSSPRAGKVLIGHISQCPRWLPPIRRMLESGHFTGNRSYLWMAFGSGKDP